MTHSEFKEAPPLHGWAIAIAAGALMFGASFVAMGIGANGAVGIGVVVALIVGIVFTIAERAPKSAPAAKVAASVAANPVVANTVATSAAPSVSSAPSAPVSEPAPQAEAIVAPAATARAEPVATPDAAPDAAPTRPQGLSAPVGAADDLKRISGVGPVLEGKLNALGFFHFWQIARWSGAEVDWVDSYLSFKGRIDRDNWIEQAMTLAKESPSKPPA